MLGCFWLLELGVDRFDVIDGDEGDCQQFADTRDIFGTGLRARKAPGLSRVGGGSTSLHTLNTRDAAIVSGRSQNTVAL